MTIESIILDADDNGFRGIRIIIKLAIIVAAIVIGAKATSKNRNYLQKAKDATGKGKLDKALEYIDLSISSEREKGDEFVLADAHNLRGDILLKKGDITEAKNAYIKAVDNNGKHVGALYNLGQLTASEADNEVQLKKAIDYFERALALTPHRNDIQKAKADAEAKL